jgi:hypothetical protein
MNSKGHNVCVMHPYVCGTWLFYKKKRSNTGVNKHHTYMMCQCNTVALTRNCHCHDQIFNILVHKMLSLQIFFQGFCYSG